jgi:hypothetical protein
MCVAQVLRSALRRRTHGVWLCAGHVFVAFDNGQHLIALDCASQASAASMVGLCERVTTSGHVSHSLAA